jgi:hypothetical protein
LVEDIVTEICSMIRAGKERVSLQQRKAAIEQRELKKEEGLVKRTQAMLKDSLRPFAGETFVVKP